MTYKFIEKEIYGIVFKYQEQKPKYLFIEMESENHGCCCGPCTTEQLASAKDVKEMIVFMQQFIDHQNRGG